MRYSSCCQQKYDSSQRKTGDNQASADTSAFRRNENRTWCRKDLHCTPECSPVHWRRRDPVSGDSENCHCCPALRTHPGSCLWQSSQQGQPASVSPTSRSANAARRRDRGSYQGCIHCRHPTESRQLETCEVSSKSARASSRRPRNSERSPASPAKTTSSNPCLKRSPD